MVYTVENSKGLMLVDARGVRITHAYEFNDETCEVKFYLTGDRQDQKRRTTVASGDGYKTGFDVVRCSAIVKGAKMVPRVKKAA